LPKYYKLFTTTINIILLVWLFLLQANRGSVRGNGVRTRRTTSVNVVNVVVAVVVVVRMMRQQRTGRA
jgi:hypothetical protein